MILPETSTAGRTGRGILMVVDTIAVLDLSLTLGIILVLALLTSFMAFLGSVGESLGEIAEMWHSPGDRILLVSGALLAIWAALRWKHVPWPRITSSDEDDGSDAA